MYVSIKESSQLKDLKNSFVLRYLNPRYHNIYKPKSRVQTALSLHCDIYSIWCYKLQDLFFSKAFSRNMSWKVGPSYNQGRLIFGLVQYVSTIESSLSAAATTSSTMWLWDYIRSTQAPSYCSVVILWSCVAKDGEEVRDRTAPDRCGIVWSRWRAVAGQHPKLKEIQSLLLSWNCSSVDLTHPPPSRAQTVGLDHSHFYRRPCSLPCHGLVLLPHPQFTRSPNSKPPPANPPHFDTCTLDSSLHPSPSHSQI